MAGLQETTSLKVEASLLKGATTLTNKHGAASQNNTTKVTLRDEQFSNRIATNIWQETACAHNPYQTAQARCHGYELTDLVKHRSFIDVFYLLFRGELPSKQQSSLLEHLFISLINPGPRHPATQAAMNAGVSKVDYAHILPIALSLQGGQHLGGKEVEYAMRFLQDAQHHAPQSIAEARLNESKPSEGDWHIIHGFGSYYGDIDPLTETLAGILLEQEAAGDVLAWCRQFVEHIRPHRLGWLPTGLAAAVLCDLGFSPRAGAGLYQIMSAPGLLAHGIELAGKPITAIPFVPQDQYVIG